MFIISFLYFVSCESSTNSSNSNPATHEEIKMSLEDKEKSNPLSFLNAEGTYRENIIGQWVLEGTVTNTATIATYKDVVLRIVYYSKTKTEIGSEEKTLFEYFKPNNPKRFKIKSAGYEGTASVGFGIISANTVE